VRNVQKVMSLIKNMQIHASFAAEDTNLILTVFLDIFP
jgi:hypothetical protein